VAAITSESGISTLAQNAKARWSRLAKKSFGLKYQLMDCKEMNMKSEKYELLICQIRSLIEGETDAVAVMSNVAAAIHQAMGFWWTGFYRVVNNELLLGPFQGPVACMHIPFGKGVCGTAWKQAETVIVPDVEQFPGHIACSSESKSEIVVPVFGNNKTVVAVLDIDSEELDTFDETDRKYLEEICKMIELNL
jgi:GAF domain-containing protein